MFKLFKNFSKIDYLFIILSVGLIALAVWFDLKIPGLTKDITNLVISSDDTVKIWSVGFKMIGCAFASAILSAIVGFFAARSSSSLGKSARLKMFNKVQSFSMEEIHKFSTASLITRTTNDVSQIQNTFAISLQLIVKAPITAVWAIVEILGKSWQWSIATAGAILALLIMIIIMVVFAIPRFKVVQKQTDDLNRVMRENLLGTRVVRAYNAENYERERFDIVNTNLTNTHLFIQKIMALLSPFMQFMMNVLSLSIYWIGIILIDKANLANKADLFSDMIVFSQYSMRVVMSFIMLTVVFVMLPRASVSAGRINEVLDTRNSINDGNGVGKTKKKGEIEFKNVSFKYPDAEEYILKNISFKAKKGGTIAFVGSTGCGKSTLINLIPRFYDVTSGEIIVDGYNIKDYKLNELRDKMGYVSQKAVIFSGSIKSNIEFNDKLTQDELDMAVKISNAEEFISEKEGKFEAEVSQGGTNLSGGQKQRLSIARAVAKKPEFYIFDDSFSALDLKTDYNVRNALKEQCKNATKFVVAQRIGTIKDADLILVLDNGEVVGIGKHEKLLKECEVYREIALSQLSKKELNWCLEII